MNGVGSREHVEHWYVHVDGLQVSHQDYDVVVNTRANLELSIAELRQALKAEHDDEL